MPTTPAAGPIATVEERLATSLATCHYFRELVDAVDVSEALESIHYDVLEPPENKETYTTEELDDLRPFAVISTEPEAGCVFGHDATSSSFRFSQSGVLWLHLEKAIDVDDLGNPAEYLRKWKNELGQIIKSGDGNQPGLLELAGVASYLAIRRVHLLGPFVGDENDEPGKGNYVWASLRIEWGRPA